jgi:hypothetical protein
MAEDRPLPCLGVLMLQTGFPRLPGDVGHPATFTMAVRRRIVAGATPRRLVRDADPAALLASAPGPPGHRLPGPVHELWASRPAR